MKITKPIASHFAAMTIVACALAAQSTLCAARADTFVVTTNADSGDGSLRAAITAANARAGADAINFNIAGSGVQTIALLSELPEITDPLVIDGTTQPGYATQTGRRAPLIELNGADTGPGSFGLRLRAGNSQLLALTINRFGTTGVTVEGDRNVIGGCYIGTDATGSIALGNGRVNGGVGIDLVNSNDNTIGRYNDGSYLTGLPNLISGNANGGIMISSSGAATADRNRISSNYIGTNAVGDAPLPNGGVGLELNNSSNNQIGASGQNGGYYIGGSNLISGNTEAGIRIIGGAFNRIASNSITGNGTYGIHLAGSSSNLIGTFYSQSQRLIATGSLISGNRSDGILIEGESAAGNGIYGNTIGLDARRTEALGNGRNGIEINNAPGTVIGVNQGRANYISSNGGIGIRINGAGARGTSVGSNYIGVNAARQDRGNGADGIRITGASDTVIGAPNRLQVGAIAFNKGAGVLIASGERNLLTFNQIYSNEKLGIDLLGDGVTPNDALDADSGPNGLLNYPDLYLAGKNGDLTEIRGALQSLPNTRFTLRFFAGVPDPSGFGEGARLVAIQDVITNVRGAAAFLVRVSRLPVAVGESITATASNDSIGTSEFSNAVIVHSDGVAPQVDFTTPRNEQQLARFTAITGTFSDRGGRGESDASGVNRVDLVIQRQSDGKYFDGREFVAEATRLTTTISGDTWIYKGALPPPDEGRYTLIALAYDRAGNRSERRITVFIDRSAPEVRFTKPDNGQPSRTFTEIAGRVIDRISRVDRVELVIRRRSDTKYFDGRDFVSDQVRLPTTLSSNGDWRYSGTLPAPGQLAEGPYDLFAIAYDAAGNRASAQVTLQIDLSGPSVRFTNPLDGQTIIDFSGIAGRVADASGIERVELVIERRSVAKYFDGRDFVSEPVRLPTVLSGNDWRYAGALPRGAQLQNGLYTLTAVAYDRAGNRGDAAVNVTLRVSAGATAQSTLKRAARYARSTLSRASSR